MTKCGFIALVGRPNVGKSTLINQLVGQKVSIVCRKRQTTRHNVLGIKTHHDYQMVFVDTPGLHQHEHHLKLNRYMNRNALRAVEDVEAVILMIDHDWRQADDIILEQLKAVKPAPPVILVINKMDLLADKHQLLPLIERCQAKFDFQQIIPISAQDPHSVDYLEQQLMPWLPEHPFFFPEQQKTDRSQRFQMAEIIREQLFSRLHDELPYELSVYIESLRKEEKLWRVDAIILVADDNHKGMIIGHKGSNLKYIGQYSRQAMEAYFHCHIDLQMWVKVKQDWYNSSYWLEQIERQ